MRTEVATTKPKRKLRCFDATRLIQPRLPGLRTGNQLVQQADVARTVSGPTLLGLGPRALKGLGPGPQGLGAQAPSGLLAGYFASLSCKGKKRAFSPSPLLKPSNTPPRSAEGLGFAMISRITGANAGQWVRLFNDLARNQKRTIRMQHAPQSRRRV